MKRAGLQEMMVDRVLSAAMRAWRSEDSRLALRTKQAIALSIPDGVLIALKKRYYARLLASSDRELLERDALALELIVKPGECVIDVGASVGFYTKRLSTLVGPAGRVWSIEPMPQTFEVLAYNVQKLGLVNVNLVNCALSDSERSAVMEVPRYRGGGECWYDARIIADGPRDGRFRRVEVTCRTLDALASDFEGPVSFIKCDVELHEHQVLKGAESTLRRWMPALLVEMLISPDEDGSASQRTVSMLAQMGYRPYCFDSERFRLRQQREKSQNIFFFGPRHRDITKGLFGV